MLIGLRKRGVLIIGSGNKVHNLGRLDPQMLETGFDWADAVNDKLKFLILNHDHQAVIDYKQLGREAALAIPAPDHYYPLLYALGLQTRSDQIQIFNNQSVMGSISMTTVRLHSEQ